MALLIGIGFPVAGMLVITVGVLAVILGLMADQISQLRLGQLPAASTVEIVSDYRQPQA